MLSPIDRSRSSSPPGARNWTPVGRPAASVPDGKREAAHPKQIAEKRVVDGAQVGDAEQFVVAFERTNSRRGHWRRRQHQQRSLQLVDQGRDEGLTAALQIGHVTLGDAPSQGSLHHAAIHALGVRGIKDRAMFGIGLNRDERTILRGERAHCANLGDRPRRDLGASRGEPFHRSFEIGRDRGLCIVDSGLVGHDEFDSLKIERAHRSVRLAAQRHVDQHAILDRVRHWADRVERA